MNNVWFDTVPSTSNICSATAGRTLAGGTLQYWSGGSWASLKTISGKTGDWSTNFQIALPISYAADCAAQDLLSYTEFDVLLVRDGVEMTGEFFPEFRGEFGGAGGVHGDLHGAPTAGPRIPRGGAGDFFEFFGPVLVIF